VIDRYTALLHTFTPLSHSGNWLNIGSDLRFYLLSTVFLCGYYYYLYIYINPVSKRTIHKLQFTYYQIR